MARPLAATPTVAKLPVAPVLVEIPPRAQPQVEIPTAVETVAETAAMGPVVLALVGPLPVDPEVSQLAAQVTAVLAVPVGLVVWPARVLPAIPPAEMAEMPAPPLSRRAVAMPMQPRRVVWAALPRVGRSIRAMAELAAPVDPAERPTPVRHMLAAALAPVATVLLEMASVAMVGTPLAIPSGGRPRAVRRSAAPAPVDRRQRVLAERAARPQVARQRAVQPRQPCHLRNQKLQASQAAMRLLAQPRVAMSSRSSMAAPRSADRAAAAVLAA